MIELTFTRDARPEHFERFLKILQENNKNNLSDENERKEHIKIKDVIYNSPATIVLWEDGSKTIVKCQKGDIYNPEFGLAMCIIKKLCDNQGNYNDIFKKWLPKKENE